MNVGMLWFDNDVKSTIERKISRAVEYYLRKYGRRPNLCYIHPSMVGKQMPLLDGIEIRLTRAVLPNHFWLGVTQEKTK